MSFNYNVTTVTVLIQVFINLIGNIVYSLTGYSGDLVGITVLALIVTILAGILGVVGTFLAMRWLKRK